MRVVLDTVVLVRALMAPHGWWGRLLFDHGDSYDMLVSAAIVAEYLEVINRPALVAKYRTIATRDLRTVRARIAAALVVQPAATPRVSRDPADDKVLAAALAGSANYIVSEDADLLTLGSYEGIQIVSAETFLRLLEEPGERRW